MTTRTEVELQALVLMNEHGLLVQGWTFQFDGSKRRLGQTMITEKIIKLSALHADNDPLSEVLDTILHEIAHALTPPIYDQWSRRWSHHGPEWRETAERIGCSARRTGLSGATLDAMERDDIELPVAARLRETDS